MASVRLHHETTSNKVTLQFSHHGKVARYSLPVRIQHHQWNNITQRVVQHPNANSLNATLQGFLTRAQRTLMDYCATHATRKMDAKQLKDIVCNDMFGTGENDKTFLNIYDEFASQKDGRTKELYDTTRRQMLASDVQLHSRSIDDINNVWLRSFKEWAKESGQAINTTNIRLRCIRAVFNYARKMEYTNAYPFFREKIKNTDIIHHDLTNEQICMLMCAPIPDALQESIIACRLMFYLIGINAKDLYYLKPSNIRNGRAEYIRAKTHKAYSIKLQPESKAIITQYSAPCCVFSPAHRYSSHREWLRRVNGDLCTFCGIIGIPTITTNWLRHSWATFAWRIGIPVDTISLALGHSFGLKVTQGYILKDNKAADNANRLVIDTIAKMFRKDVRKDV